MAIKEIISGELKGYMVRVRKRGHYDKSIVVTKQAKLIGATIVEAKKKERELRDLAQAEMKTMESDGITFIKLLDKWRFLDLMQNVRDTTTLADYERTIRIYCEPIFKVPIGRLTEGHIEDIYATMRELEKSHGRMKAVKSGINYLYDWAHRERLIPRHMQSPAKSARLPKNKSKREQPILNRQEIRLFLDKAREESHNFYYLWAVAFLTGMRSGELYALEWTDVDFGRGIITVSKSFNFRMNAVKSTKSGMTRQVPISSELSQLLKELKIQTAPTGLVLPRINAWKKGSAALRTRDFCKAIGIREINFHATRACWAIQCLEMGVSVPTVMRIGGWQEFKSFQHYLRLSGVEIRGATEGLNLLPEKRAKAEVINLEISR